MFFEQYCKRFNKKVRYSGNRKFSAHLEDRGGETVYIVQNQNGKDVYKHAEGFGKTERGALCGLIRKIRGQKIYWIGAGSEPQRQVVPTDLRIDVYT